MKIRAKSAIALAFAIICAAPSLAASDNFDREKLGKKWVVVNPPLTVADGKLHGGTSAGFGAFGYFKPSTNDLTISATVALTDNSDQYTALVIGNIADQKDAFIKLQNFADNTFTQAAFYNGNNGNGDFFQLMQPVPSPAKLTVSLCGTMAVMKIKSKVPTQTYAYDYGSQADQFGAGGGVGIYGVATIDNYKSKPGANCTLTADTIIIKQSSAADWSKQRRD